ncbi:MAG: hypothetical protein JWQ35_671 [Bacteriovoracaceae bacterium]|nr:hypothetical protein [Bacteriovoracaceae bacterium]
MRKKDSQMKTNEAKATQNLPQKHANNAEISASGKLREQSARELISELHHKNFTGRLILSYREKLKKIWFYQGEVFRIQSNLVPELFGQMMIERNWMNENDLQECLTRQRDSKSPRLLGDIVKEFYQVKEDEIDILETHQKMRSLIQALTWEDGAYEYASMHLKAVEPPEVPFEEFEKSLKLLVEATEDKDLGLLFRTIQPWKPKTGAVNLAEFPVWSILAGCRGAGVSGILSIRKQNKLHEIVIKHGVPLTLYEGSFGQPRQTIVVRQASEEHEKFFTGQVFKLFSFLAGTAHLRALGDAVSLHSDAKGKFSTEREQNTMVFGKQHSEIQSQLMSQFSGKDLKIKFSSFYYKISFVVQKLIMSFLGHR